VPVRSLRLFLAESNEFPVGENNSAVQKEGSLHKSQGVGKVPNSRTLSISFLQIIEENLSADHAFLINS
jgi:hypothetical protein